MPGQRRIRAYRATAALSGLLMLSACNLPNNRYNYNQYADVQSNGIRAYPPPYKSGGQFNYEFDGCDALSKQNSDPKAQIIIFAVCMRRFGNNVSVPDWVISQLSSQDASSSPNLGYPNQQPLLQILPFTNGDAFADTPQSNQSPYNPPQVGTPLLSDDQEGKLLHDAALALGSSYGACKLLSAEPPLLADCMATRWVQKMFLSVGKNVLIPAVCHNPDIVRRLFKGVEAAAPRMPSIVLRALGCS